MWRRSSGGAETTELESGVTAVIPRYLLSADERLQLSPVLAKHMEEARGSPYDRQVHINPNYQAVTSRYHRPQYAAATLPPKTVDRGGSRGPVTPSRLESDAPLAMSATQSPRPISGGASGRSATPQRASPSRRSLSPSLTKYPLVQSRYLQDPRLSAPRPSPSATASSPHRDVTPVRVFTAPFRAGLRAATPDEISRRNKALLSSATASSSHQKPVTHSVVGAYIRQSTPSRSRTPERPPAVLSPGYRLASPGRSPSVVRGQSPNAHRQSQHRVISPFSRARSPQPLRKKFAEEEQFILKWRDERSSVRVADGHVPRVAKLSIGYELSRPESPGPPPMIRWAPQPTPRSTLAPANPAAPTPSDGALSPAR